MINNVFVRKYGSLYLLLILASVSGLLMLIEPVSVFLESGHVSKASPWPWVMLEEPMIALTRYLTIFVVLASFFRILGLTFDIDDIFYKVLRLYWVEFVVFLLFCAMLVFQLRAIRGLALILPFVVPIIQGGILAKCIAGGGPHGLGGLAIFLVSSLLVGIGGILHTLLYDYIVSMLT